MSVHRQRVSSPSFQELLRLLHFASGVPAGSPPSPSKISEIQDWLHRAIEGQVKTLTVKSVVSMWYACFSCVAELEPLRENGKAGGLDVALLSFVTRNDGIGNGNPSMPRGPEGRSQQVFQDAQKKPIRLGGQDAPQSVHHRSDLHHKLSRKIVNNYEVIFIEGLSVKGLSRVTVCGNRRGMGGIRGSYSSMLVERASVVRVEPNPKRLSDRRAVLGFG